MRRVLSLKNSLILSASFTALSNYNINQYCATTQSQRKYLKFASSMIPHPEKAHKGGEDALFAHEKILVVADGVGGWADHGVDPGLYSKELCKHIGEQFLKNQDHYILNPKDLIIKAHGLTKARGSTTVCAITIDDVDLLVRSANIGDSGYAIFRRKEDKYELVFKSKEQQRGFNFPYQIGSEGDPPSCAVIDQHEVKIQDIIILGTDGLFDNLSANQIQLILEDDQKSNKNLDLERLARAISNYAYKLSLDQNYLSPFSRSAKQYGYRFMGGKSDDITVIVAEVNLK